MQQSAFDSYKQDVKTGDKDYIVRSLLKTKDALDIEKRQVIKVFFPQSARMYFGKKYMKDAYCIIDELSIEIHGEKIFYEGQMIYKEGKIPIIIYRKYKSFVYAWNKGFDLYEKLEKKGIDDWVEEQIQEQPQSIIDEHVAKIEKDITSYKTKIDTHMRKEWAMERYVKYRTFTILVLTRSKLAEQYGNKGQIKALRRCIYNVFNKCGDLLLPDSDLPESDYNKMTLIHEESRELFLKHIKKCYEKLNHFVYTNMLTNFACDVWYFRKYRIEGLSDDHFVINLRGQAIQTIKCYLQQTLEQSKDYEKRFTKEKKFKKVPKRTVEEIFASLKEKYPKDHEELLIEPMDELDDIHKNKMKLISVTDSLDLKMKNLLLNKNEDVNDNFQEDFNQNMKDILGIKTNVNEEINDDGNSLSDNEDHDLNENDEKLTIKEDEKLTIKEDENSLSDNENSLSDNEKS
tara:strand:+ start:2836 stop:4212 length:1377 start_codon:yes stop_codon:yes gene_type:complete